MDETIEEQVGGSQKTNGGEEPPLVRMEGITKRFGGLTALNDVALDVDYSEVVGLVGDNGAGKSTLINILAGALDQTQGDIYYKGRKVEIKAPEDAKELGIETVYQDLALADNIDVAGNLFLGRELSKYTLGPLNFLAKRKMSDKAQEILDVLNINFDSMNAKVKNLSGGQRQAIAVARSIYSDPDLVILDEPTAALAVEESERVLELITDLKDQGIAVIFISHTLQEVFKVADRIVILNQGNKVGDLQPNETDMDKVVKLMIGGRYQTNESV
ncbi:MAG: ATP-binding cassette domain-containing protein [Candidatus Bipolaricaulota bacterium]|nr:sugar ABC transporter ATP-binding protein [Candidatus Bipolaricaulota bacterium]MBS3791666.1 sugar ABC transporter ATP-binding protein [Candidatus Bipolaricaulota bacterium]